MKRLRHILLLTALASTILGCKKDDETDINPKVQSLASSNWITSSFTVNPAIPLTDSSGNPTGQVVTDILAEYENCIKDDIIKFYTNQTYVFDEGASKCNTGDGQVFEAGDWYLSADEGTIVMKSGNISGVGIIYSDGIFETQDAPTLVNWTIKELSNNNLTISYERMGGNTTYTFTRTFTPNK